MAGASLAENEWGSEWHQSDAWQNADSYNSSDDKKNIDKTSLPYIIQIVNSCTSVISNVDILDSYKQRTVANFGQPIPANGHGGITITSNIVGVSYIEFLAQTEQSPMKIGRTMIVSTTSGQLSQSLQITHRDANGNRADHVIPPIVDPYQKQTDRIVDDYEYLVDGYTRLRFNQINIDTTVAVYLFPITKFSSTQIVAGRESLKDYTSPSIVKVAALQIKDSIKIKSSPA